MRYRKYKGEKGNDEKFLAEGFSCGGIAHAGNGFELALMPGYRHHLAVTGGECVCVVSSSFTEKIFAGEKRIFDGSANVRLMGAFNAYYVTLPEGSGMDMDVVELSGGKKDIDVPEGATAAGYYCAEGYAVVSSGDETVMLECGEQVIFYGEPDELSSLGVMGEGKAAGFIVSGEASDTAEPLKEKKQGEKKEPLTAGDLYCAFMIAVTNSRAAKLIVPFRRKNWFDEELFRAVESVRRKHISALVWVLVFLIICAAAGKSFEFSDLILTGVLSAVINLAVIMPVIYALVIPRPAGEHIKPRSEMTEEEKRVQDRRDNVVEHRKRVLKRY